jgi:peptidoglycan/LPS O-acetylase OafA/YrhL
MTDYLSEARALHSGKYRPDIDGIRAIAVSSVVLCHAFPSILPGGFIGVDVFFVISGYLISNILIKNLNTGSFSILTFYDRRIRRIFPALLVVVLFVLAFGWVCLFRPEFESLGRHVSASTLFSENFLLWSESGYFDTSSNLKPTLHLWSLAIEEQFYILWPLLMYAAHRLRINFIVVIVVLAAASFAINIRDIHTDATAAYYSPLGRSWELMVGCGLAYAKANHPALLSTHRNMQSLAGALLIGLALAFIRPHSGFPGFWALLPTFGTFLLLSAGENAWFNRRVLSTSPMVWCGLISYPLYLWHWPFLSFGHFIFGDVSPAKAAVCVLSAVVAAFLTYYFVERPIRRTATKPRVAFVLTGAMAGMLACGVLVTTQTISPRLKLFDTPTGNEWDFLTKLKPDVKDNSKNVYSLHPDRPNQVLFIGDSHLAQYAARLDKIIGENPERPGAILVVGSGCIPIEGWGGKYREMCGQMKETAYAMAEDARFKTIVIGGAWDIYFSEDGQYATNGGKQISLTSIEGRRLALDHLQQRIAGFIRAGKDVVLLLDSPVSNSFNPTGPQLRLSLSTKNFEASGTTKIDPRLRELHQELAAWAKQTGARVIDPTDAVCAGDVCHVTTVTGQPMYRNRDHFNPDWARENATFIDVALER